MCICMDRCEGWGPYFHAQTTQPPPPLSLYVWQGRSGEYPWLLEALQQEQDAADAEGGEAASYETAEERRRQQLLRQQAFHQEVVARLEREARARSLKVDVV